MDKRQGYVGRISIDCIHRCGNEATRRHSNFLQLQEAIFEKPIQCSDQILGFASIILKKSVYSSRSVLKAFFKKLAPCNLMDRMQGLQRDTDYLKSTAQNPGKSLSRRVVLIF